MITAPDQPGKLTPGWHPDPWGDGRALRWWDGRQWTAATRPLSGPEREKPRRRSVVFPLTFATFVLAVIVIAVTMTRSDVTKVSVGGMTVDFSAKQITAQQPAMQEKLASADANAQTAPAAQQDTAVSFAGDWRSMGGGVLYTWHIEQYGSAVAINEYVQPYGTTAVGQGSVSGSRLMAQFQIIDGSTGRADMELQADGSLNGTVTNLVSGAAHYTSFRR